MRVLVLEGVGLAIPDQIVEAIEGVASSGGPELGPWLPSIFDGRSTPASGRRRALRLRGGARVEVPAAMHIAEVGELLDLPDLLREIGERQGVVGLVELPEALTLVCDPRRLPQVGEAGLVEGAD
ncbi:hypothetical protein ENSA5_10760 [Enhygromyxa salina]|uniref:CheW-like domain-containing protein n=1 Tax=Enhygromyxa salina TaxID=215803 RepID=A0A2S9YGH9_9BACT|nr:hypothetical protein [Enhygromyxa salina]PRQ04116.1 hypothetical protein ENSA5_10760 [Enhygromyxa salina]